MDISHYGMTAEDDSINCGINYAPDVAIQWHDAIIEEDAIRCDPAMKEKSTSCHGSVSCPCLLPIFDAATDENSISCHTIISADSPPNTDDKPEGLDNTTATEDSTSGQKCRNPAADENSL